MSINKNKVIVVHNTMKYSIEIIIKKKTTDTPNDNHKNCAE